MKYESACKVAYLFFRDYELYGIFRVMDIKDKWIFFGGNPNTKYYNIRTVSVEKSTGECEWFNTNIEENEKLLSEGLELELPDKYSYKAS